eukprot:m.150171 g.150171  ORF g.150171 m.150171 type:complete len:78 (-) comp52793_c0_seq4:616-849(-)
MEVCPSSLFPFIPRQSFQSLDALSCYGAKDKDDLVERELQRVDRKQKKKIRHLERMLRSTEAFSISQLTIVSQCRWC